MSKNSIVPSTGHLGSNWPSYFNFPQGVSGLISAGGWTSGNEGYIQQTFLGATIKNFNLSAGFGNNSSSLSVTLVNDEYNKSDGTGAGIGDDVYHSGQFDYFAPPPVGTPVFFKFGKNFATIEQAWRNAVDQIYGSGTLPSGSDIKIVETNQFPIPYNEAYYMDIETSDIKNNKFVFVDRSAFIASGEYTGDKYNGDDGIPGESESQKQQNSFSGETQEVEQDFSSRGKDHFIFGGILQSYTENRSETGNPLFTVQVADPREILSNVVLILNNYTGSIYGNKNYLNVYGFLEYDTSDDLKKQIEKQKIEGYASGVIESSGTWITDLPFVDASGNAIKKLNNNLEKIIDQETGEIEYFGSDIYRFPPIDYEKLKDDQSNAPSSSGNSSPAASGETITFPEFFPMTGEGFARRCDQGIPWYRVRQSIEALFNYKGPLPKEYEEKSFGGPINFRGFNYVVDFNGIPIEKISKMYFIDFDQIDLLSLLQEICDTISHDLYVSLIPVIYHPAYLSIAKQNEIYSGVESNSQQTEEEKNPDSGNTSKLIAGIIRIDAIDRSNPPTVGAIKQYLNEKIAKGIDIISQDVGYELSNIVTDKMLVGAQEVTNHFFIDNKDRDFLQLRRKNGGIDKAGFEQLQKSQWELETALKQQIIPFYGFINKDVPTIPRGWGSYQQILLDTSGLDAFGVGDYYVATELELRHASISYEQWARFLLSYNENYIEEIGENFLFYRALAGSTPAKPSEIPEDPNDLFNPSGLYNREFGVTVPRSVFISEKNYIDEETGYPASRCCPPFGYPLYYKRAEAIGIPEASTVKFQNALNEVISNYENLQKEAIKKDELLILRKQSINRGIQNSYETFSSIVKNFEFNSESALQSLKEFTEASRLSLEIESSVAAASGAAIIKEQLMNNKDFIMSMNRLSKKGLKNAKKVYQFIKSIADKHLGKTFLVKIPKKCNVFYKEEIELWEEEKIIDESKPKDEKNTTKEKDPKVNNIKYGPFGFKPSPIYSGINYYNNPENLDSLLNPYRDSIKSSGLFLDYLDFSPPSGESISPASGASSGTLDSEIYGYRYGALKNYFNPISDKWEFNYAPEPQGGFHEYSLIDRMIDFGPAVNLLLEITASIFGGLGLPIKIPEQNLPQGQKSQLIPLDLTNFRNEDGRISTYVRFDNSEYLDFSEVGSENITQQISTAVGFITDIAEQLDNIEADNDQSFEQIAALLNDQKKPKSLAFVKCDVDEKFYMLPKLEKVKTKVYGRKTKFVSNVRSLRMIEITENNKKKTVPSQPYALPIFTLAVSGGYENGIDAEIVDFARIKPDNEKNSRLIDTKVENLNSEHVYALITLPGKVVSTIDKRYVDGPYQAFNAQGIKHILTQDVVKAPDYFKFEEPSPMVGSGIPLDCEKFTFAQLNDAKSTQKHLIKDLQFANPEIATFSQPSPVYPNLICLPLLSKERNYGPWFSSSIINGQSNSGIRYSDIGGKVEFIKNENLAPWNYAGYQLMNEAGSLEAQFSNSLLLFSERGNFSMADSPQGLQLARPLLFDVGGSGNAPLVTSISVDVGGEEIRTNVGMEMYVNRFGKLAKQKEEAIAKIARERQKLVDQKNKLIRQNYFKSMNRQKFSNSQISQIISLADNSSKLYSAIERGERGLDKIVLSLSKNDEDMAIRGPDNKISGVITNSTYNTSASFKNSSQLSEIADIISNNGDENLLNSIWNNTAGVSLEEWLTGYSTLPIGGITPSYNEFPSFPNAPYRNYIEDQLGRD
jgi:hypothetical protein